MTISADPTSVGAQLVGRDGGGRGLGMDFARMMALEPHGTDVFVGTGPQYPWGGLYGGQIVAQGLRAAQLTVDDEFVLHSIHAYFIRMGDHTEPVRFEVDRLRNGRSFCTRRVVARQATGAILNLACSFQRPEEGSVLQTIAMPDVAGPEGIDDDSWSPMFERRPALPRGTGDQPGAWAGLWMRPPGPVEPSLAHAALPYLSDDVPTDAVLPQHPEALPGGENHERFMVASLDHAIWFHRAFDPAEWHLFDATSQGFGNGRGLSVGHVFSTEGVHVATVTQEVLIRRSRRSG